MRNILGLVLLIVSINSFGQNPANYQYRVVYERLRGLMPDSVLHIPRYNGVPSGLRGGSATHDGAIAADTLNGRIYFYWNAVWNRLASYADLSSGSRFGIEDITTPSDRYTSFHGTRSLTLDSLFSGYITFKGSEGFSIADYLTGLDFISYNTVSGSRLFSQDGNNYTQVDDGRAAFVVGTNDSILLFSTSGKVSIPNIPYNSSAGIVHLGLDTVAGSPTFNRLVRKTASGSTPTWQQSLTAGSTLTTNNTATQGANNFTFTSTNSVGTVDINQTGGFGSALRLNSSGTYTLFSDNSVGTYGAYLRTSNSSTSTVLPVLHLERNSTGTASAGIGAGIRFSNEFSDGSQDRTHDINAKLSNVTAGSFTGEFDLTSYDAGALETFMNIQKDLVRINDNADTLATKAYARSVGGGGGSNFANADLTFTGDRFHELDDNQLEIANQGANQILIDPVNRRYAFGDIPATGNGRSLIIIDTATVTDGYKLPAMQEAATSKILYYNTTTGGITYDDVAASPTFEDWYQIKDEILIDDRQGLDYNQSGTGANCTNLTGTNIIDGWLFGLNMETGTTNSGFAFVYSAISPGGAFNPISINSATRYNVGFKVRYEDVSDGTETYDSFWGFADNNSSTSGITDGVYFRYAHTDSSGTWIAVTESNGTKTEDAVGSAVAADTDYELEISVFGGNAYFYIDKVLVSTIPTNIPTGSTRNTSIAGGIFKSAGTTTRKAYVDWIAFGTRKS